MKLYNQQLKIVQQLILGCSCKEIASQLDINIKRFYMHKYNILRKFGMKGDSEFVHFLHKQGGQIKIHYKEKHVI
ncbi:helix-turn-helix transcriptional regulator [Enterobacter cloacae]|uniref:helix-turn-helix transcriptional regulator n=1 Tax=Enterobacter cloacae TaxID=550 RepID=UPI003BF4EDAA